MPLEPGTTLGPYHVTAKIGEGGMGVVYRARDTKLDRDVALKVLPDAFTQDPDRLARFEREAKVLASLNHPNIAAIYGLEEADDIRALVLELVEGPTLADRIKQGPIPLDEALPIAKQIAEALEAAHEAGVIHRDLKPANIKVKHDGTVKVLDFGLAKALDPSPEGDPSQSPTLTAAATQMGVIMGTAAYMSPEQARGKPVDKRADIWAFGCVLYEMLTGRRAFRGADVSLTLAEVMKSEPDWGALSASTPASIRRLLERGLVKERTGRLQAIGDARIEIDEALTRRDPGLGATSSVPRRRWRGSLSHGFTAVGTAGVLGVALWFLGVFPPQEVVVSQAVTRATIALPEGQRQSRLKWAPIALSPDGTLLAYVARDSSGAHLFLRRLDSFETRKIPDSENAMQPFFSWDSEWVGFFSTGRLKKVSVMGGTPLTVTQAPFAYGASWGSDDTIIFTPILGAGIWSVSADGGTPEQLTVPDNGDAGYAHVWPQILPGGRHILFSMWGRDDGPHVLDIDAGEWHRARDGVTGGDMYLPSGHLVYADAEGSGALLAAPFSPDELAMTMSPVTVLDDVRFFDSASARPFLAVSKTGTAVYVTNAAGEATVMWVDRQGMTAPIRIEAGRVAGIRLSPNGETAVFHDEQGSLWTLDIERGSVEILLRAQPTQGIGSYSPVWHPDGRHVTFSYATDGWDLYEVDVGTRSEHRALVISDHDLTPGSWSADGRLLTYTEEHPVTASDIWVVARGEEPIPVLQTPNSEYSPALSPDGRLLAYVSDVSGQYEVHVRTYPEGEVRTVSVNGGEEPAWSQDGELFFRQGDQLLLAKVTADPELDVSAPIKLFEMPLDRAMVGDSYSGAYYDVSPEADRFLVVSERPTTEFMLIQNWFEELRDRVPTN